MKKLARIALLSIAALSIGNQQTFSAASAEATPESAALRGAVIVARLPSDLMVSSTGPRPVPDPALLEAWSQIYRQQSPIQLREGKTVSGRSLAQYLLDQAIPVEWDTHNVCGNGACSVLFCAAGRCTYPNSKAGVAPIYVTPSERGDLQSLVSTLAHEIFHRTQPFGSVKSTRYEEFWAFVVGARVSQSDWPSFGAYDSLDPNQLNLWFRENGLEYYFRYPEYPATVEAQVYRGSQGGDPYSGIPPQAYGASQTR